MFVQAGNQNKDDNDINKMMGDAIDKAMKENTKVKKMEDLPINSVLSKIDNDNNQVGQMLSAIWNRPQATFASKISLSENKASVTREVDQGLETIEIDTVVQLPNTDAGF